MSRNDKTMSLNNYNCLLSGLDVITVKFEGKKIWTAVRSHRNNQLEKLKNKSWKTRPWMGKPAWISN